MRCTLTKESDRNGNGSDRRGRQVAPRSPQERADSRPGDSAQPPIRRSAVTRGRSTPAKSSLAARGGRPRRTLSNSQSQNVSVLPMPEGVQILDRGIDTCSIAFRPEEQDTIWKHLAVGEELGRRVGSEEAIILADHRIQRRGGWFFEISEPIAGARWFWWRKHRTIVCEGRLARIAGEVEDEDGGPATLGSLQDLRTAAVVAPYFFEHMTWPSRLPADGGRLRRLDLAVDLGFPAPCGLQSSPLGLQFLTMMSCLNVPGLQRTVWYGGSQAQTVYFRRGKVVKFRVYDKSVQSGTGPAGTRIRIERQLRWPKRDQPRPGDITAADLERLWTGELKAWAEAGQTVTVGGITEVHAAILAAVDEGRLSPLAGRSCSATRHIRRWGAAAPGGRRTGKATWPRAVRRNCGRSACA